MAGEVGISEKSVRHIPKQDPGQRPFMFTSRTLQRLDEGCTASQVSLVAPPRRWWPSQIVFGDEALFIAEATANLQNDRVMTQTIGTVNANSRMPYRTGDPASVMIRAVTTSGGKSPLIFIKPRVKLDPVYYLQKKS